MKHRRKSNRFNRERGQRRLILKNLLKALIVNEKVETTEARARAVKSLFDRMMSKAIEGSLNSRRLLQAFLQDKKIVNKLFGKIAPLVSRRKGGYTRVVRLKERRGDGALVERVELVEKTEKEEIKKEKKEKKVKETTEVKPKK